MSDQHLDKSHEDRAAAYRADVLARIAAAAAEARSRRSGPHDREPRR